MNLPVYLDFNATTPVHPAVVDAMMPYFTQFYGNPASNHSYGFKLRKAIETGREELSSLIDCEPDEIVLTSCGSESNNLAIKGTAYAMDNRGKQIIVSAVDHPAVRNATNFLERQGFTITVIPVDSNGLVDPNAIREAITDRTILISVILAQNEIGSIQPVREIAAIGRERGVTVHTDAAQAVGKAPVSVKELGVDLMTMAGNKFYGPKGVGALFVRRGVRLEALIHGAGHQGGLRSGTENAAFAVAIGKAASIAATRLEHYKSKVKRLRDLLHQQIEQRVPDALLNGHPELRLPNTLNLSFPGIDSTELLSEISDSVACSTGSGCHSGRSEPSEILLALGREPQIASAALRLSLGAETTEADVITAAAAITNGVHRLHAS